MTSIASSAWPSGWTASQPPAVGFSFVAAGEGAPRTRGGFAERDLGLAAASGGALGARHLRGAGGEGRAHDLGFQLLLVVAGTLELETADGVIALGRDDAVRIPARVWHELRAADGEVELLEISAPADGGRALERAQARSREPLGVSREAPERWVKGAGPRRFFGYRDLETEAPTDGRVHLHLVRAAEPAPGGTGWHYHSMAQIFVILEGEGSIGVEDHGTFPLRPGDAMCVGAGPRMRHNVSEISSDYRLIELCAPADYETIATAAPPGFDY